MVCWISLVNLDNKPRLMHTRKCFAFVYEKNSVLLNIKSSVECKKISFEFNCLITSYFFHRNVNTLSLDPHNVSKCVILPVL